MTRQRRRVALAAIGLLIGAVAAFLGIGGGVAIVPLLAVGFRLDQRKAAGTSLGVVFFVVATGIAVDLVVGTAETRPAVLAVLLIAPTSMLAARAVAPWIKRLPIAVLRRVFALVLLAAAAKLFELPPFGEHSGGWFAYRDPGATEVLVLPLLGLAVGAIATLVGIGGGLLVVPALGLLFFDLSWLQCRATSLLIVAPTALIGYASHLGQGTADASFVRWLAPACAFGSVLGSIAVHSADTDLFQRVFGAFLAAVALRLLLSRPPENRASG